MDLLKKWASMPRRKDIPDWDIFFIDLAHRISTRSPDNQTQCGAIITDASHHILSTGYNGFMQGINDNILPTMRPDKYAWMLHAELNSILHCQNREAAHTIYITAQPCLHCFQCIVQYGIKNIVYNKHRVTHMTANEEANTLFNIAKKLTKNKVKIRTINYEFFDQNGKKGYVGKSNKSISRRRVSNSRRIS